MNTRTWHVRTPGIRIQLTLWYLLVFALLLFCSDIVLYFGLQQSLQGNLDTALQLRAQQLASTISNDGGTVHIESETPGLENAANEQRSGVHPLTDVNFGVLVRVFDIRGHTIRLSPAFHTLLVPSISVTQALHGTPWQGTVSTATGQNVRLYSAVLVDNDAPFAVIQVGASLAQLETTLQSLMLVLALLSPLVLVLGALGSYWLAARAFRPIDTLTRTAQALEAGDLHQRVPVPQTRDEVYRLAQTFNEMLDRLENAFARQRRFVADASHELRTPITVISTLAETALLGAVTEQEAIATLESITGETERLGHLIHDLLALARADEGQTPLECEPVRLDVLVQAVAASRSSLAEKRTITVQVETPEAVTISGDEARLIQMVMNLLENALVYTPPGGQVMLTVGETATRAYLIMKDTGIGIPANHLPHIFERFYRVDQARAHTHEPHSGLGLSIVEWIVRAHAGTITVESQVGQGSCFRVMFPIYEEDSFSSPSLASQRERSNHLGKH